MKSIAVIFLLSLSYSITSAQSNSEKWLLPGGVRPVHYDLTLYTYIERFNENDESSFDFNGDLSIDLEVEFLGQNAVLPQIVLHRDKTINITKASMLGPNGDYLVSVADYDEETNKQKFNVTPPLRYNASYTLQLSYTGINTNDTLGFYRSSYTSGGNKRWFVTTHFESAGARRAFPCFDEPKYKATYNITLAFAQSLVTQGYHGLSNAEIFSEVNTGDGWHRTQFQRTPYPLSSYLVAFIVSDFSGSLPFASFNSSWEGGPPTKFFRTWGPPDSINRGLDTIAQEFGPVLIEKYTEILQHGFAYNKMDLAAIRDFRIGAMENWGLITFKDTRLLPENATLADKMGVAKIVSHELAHQWFGNLVTLHWWSDIWLNEAFGRYFEYFAVDRLNIPGENITGWNLLGQFVTSEIQGKAFVTDGYYASHALTTEVWQSEDVDAIFDNIPYAKGASILRMWYHCVGDYIFYQSLNNYLESSKFTVQYPEGLLFNFYTTIQEAPLAEQPQLPVSVIDLFTDWIKEPGYPVLNVKRDRNTLNFQQARFLFDEDSPSNQTSPFYVPLTYSSNVELRFANMTPTKYFMKGDVTASLSMERSDALWYIVNNQLTGYYRVSYEADNWLALFQVLNDSNSFEIIHELNRAQIIDDSAALSIHTNDVSVSIALDILKYLRHENSLAPWRAGMLAIKRYLEIFSRDSELYSGFKEFALGLVQKGLKTVRERQYTPATEILEIDLEEFNSFIASDMDCEARVRFFDDNDELSDKTSKDNSKMAQRHSLWIRKNRNELMDWFMSL